MQLFYTVMFLFGGAISLQAPQLTSHVLLEENCHAFLYTVTMLHCVEVQRAYVHLIKGIWLPGWRGSIFLM